MKSLLAKLVLAGVFANLLLAGGCVSKADYDKLWAMNQRVNEQLDAAKDKIRMLEADKLKLEAELTDRDNRIKALEDQLALLTNAKNALDAELARLQEQLKGMGNVQPVPLAVLPPDLDKALKDLADKYPELMEYFPKLGMVKLKADLTFELGSDKVNPNAEAALKKFAEIMNTETAKPFHMYIAGHTDDVPISKPETLREHKSNWGLSADRAIAVIRVLFDGGVEQVRMGAMGFSMYHPIAANAPNRKGNAANRRVEIWILSANRFLTQPGPTVEEEGITHEMRKARGRTTTAPAPEPGDEK